MPKAVRLMVVVAEKPECGFVVLHALHRRAGAFHIKDYRLGDAMHGQVAGDRELVAVLRHVGAGEGGGGEFGHFKESIGLPGRCRGRLTPVFTVPTSMVAVTVDLVTSASL